MKKVLMFVAIATVTAGVGLAISGPPRSSQKPVSTPQKSASAAVAPGVGTEMPNYAPIKYQYLPPSYDSGPASGSFRSGCSGGSCCPK
jgi:hypothetical protein